MPSPDVMIDPELSTLLTPHRPAEAGLLERSLVTEGCRDPLVVWAETGILLDGHFRHDTCNRHGVPFQVQAVSLPDRAAAVAWRLSRQLARRNLCPLQASYFRGKMFATARRPGNRTDRTSGQNVSKSMAAEHGVAPRTLTRDAEFAVAVDRLGAKFGPEFRTLVLTRQARLSRREVLELAAAPVPKRPASPVPRTDRDRRPTADDLPLESRPGLHDAWDHAGAEERLELLERPDVRAFATALLRAEVNRE